ncbi:hypothetical protein HNR34_002988 [Geobacillus subterraneus]
MIRPNLLPSASLPEGVNFLSKRLDHLVYITNIIEKTKRNTFGILSEPSTLNRIVHHRQEKGVPSAGHLAVTPSRSLAVTMPYARAAAYQLPSR